mmetsp:Transcript_54025/g.145633  ORF Transcript_54025/g.145633 Transcript_54025/m.145633 type:complete len:616 (+) Transcript_54025:114-1961(+)
METEDVVAGAGTPTPSSAKELSWKMSAIGSPDLSAEERRCMLAAAGVESPIPRPCTPLALLQLPSPCRTTPRRSAAAEARRCSVAASASSRGVTPRSAELLESSSPSRSITIAGTDGLHNGSAPSSASGLPRWCSRLSLASAAASIAPPSSEDTSQSESAGLFIVRSLARSSVSSAFSELSESEPVGLADRRRSLDAPMPVFGTSACSSAFSARSVDTRRSSEASMPAFRCPVRPSSSSASSANALPLLSDRMSAVDASSGRASLVSDVQSHGRTSGRPSEACAPTAVPPTQACVDPPGGADGGRSLFMATTPPVPTLNLRRLASGDACREVELPMRRIASGDACREVQLTSRAPLLSPPNVTAAQEPLSPGNPVCPPPNRAVRTSNMRSMALAQREAALDGREQRLEERERRLEGRLAALEDLSKHSAELLARERLLDERLDVLEDASDVQGEQRRSAASAPASRRRARADASPPPRPARAAASPWRQGPSCCTIVAFVSLLVFRLVFGALRRPPALPSATIAATPSLQAPPPLPEAAAAGLTRLGGNATRRGPTARRVAAMGTDLPPAPPLAELPSAEGPCLTCSLLGEETRSRAGAVFGAVMGFVVYSGMSP